MSWTKGRVSRGRWQLVTETAYGARVSTVELPFPHVGGDYETCVFDASSGSDVVERYPNRVEAAKGHARHVSEYGGPK